MMRAEAKRRRKADRLVVGLAPWIRLSCNAAATVRHG